MVDSVSEIIKKVVKEEKNQEPCRQHELTYDSSSETLEPVYFWILDMMNSLFEDKVEKIIDNFTSSPGSGHFSEIGGKKSVMQKNVTETMGTINIVIKSIINLIYDLKEFEMRLEHYQIAKSENKDKERAGLLALKQIWMDNVDIKRGRGSINMLAQELNFITLRDAFMAANSMDDVKKFDLNDRVKRILEARVLEFLEWKKLSEEELKKRFSIEKNYLKSQVNMLQLYSRWVKPYLKAAQQLEMSGNEKNPELVSTFNTMVLELTIIGKKKIKVEDEILESKLPKGIKTTKRDYYAVVIVDFHFRGIPQKIGQHYVFGGKTTVSFKGYGLNNEELKMLDEELKKSDINDSLKLLEGATTASLDELKKDIDHFLKDKKKGEEKEEVKNPFSALFSPLFKKKEEKKEEEKELKIEDIKKDRYSEKLIREIAKANASKNCFTVFDVYKKAHGMASHDDPFE